MINTHSILFDLDGTLVDTAPDMAFCLNQLRLKYKLPELAHSAIRPRVGDGARELIRLGFNTTNDPERELSLITEYLNLYELHTTTTTCLFNNMEKVLDFLDDKHIPWGIVTNKPSRFTASILKTLDLDIRTLCVICGDTLTKRKPDPEPLLFACQQLSKPPEHCLYIGDSKMDVIASKAAGMKSMVALYGYIKTEEDPFTWQADSYVREPIDIIPLLQQHLSN